MKILCAFFLVSGVLCTNLHLWANCHEEIQYLVPNEPTTLKDHGVKIFVKGPNGQSLAFALNRGWLVMELFHGIDSVSHRSQRLHLSQLTKLIHLWSYPVPIMLDGQVVARISAVNPDFTSLEIVSSR